MSAGAGSQQGVTTVGPDGRVVSRWKSLVHNFLFKNMNIMSLTFVLFTVLPGIILFFLEKIEQHFMRLCFAEIFFQISTYQLKKEKI